MMHRCRKPGRRRIPALSMTLALLAPWLVISCSDGPAEPDPSPTPPVSPPISPPVRPELVPLWALYESTNGPEWHHSTNWLTDAPLETWHGVTVDDQGDVSALDLARNNLSGEIPPELGDLAGLERLRLQENGLTGGIPSELDNLGALRHLRLQGNDLSGSVPPELGRLTRLQFLVLSNNPGLAGPLPVSMIALDRLATIETAGTALCAPVDPDFQVWIRGVTRLVPRCLDVTGPTTVYLTQVVQSRSIPVPLVADRAAWLRVFVTAPDSTSELIPPVRATFHVNGAGTHTAEIPAGTEVIRPTVEEGRLAASANAEIPGEIIRPGLELVVEIDPEGTLDAALGVARRIPETGRMAVDVLEVPELDLTLIPFLWTRVPDSTIVETIDAMAADPERHSLLRDARKLLPVAGLRVTAHELGHNMSLDHAPCGDPAGVDPSYPHADGRIGSWGWGYIALGRRQMISPLRPDLMSYCYPPWISGYHFTNALHFRNVHEGITAAAVGSAGTSAARSLLLWGGVDEAGAPFLEPSFVVDAPATLPESGGGPFELAGRSRGGDVLFSLSFDMPEIADGDGSSAFVFALPTEPLWAGELASITLFGPGGSATLDGDTDRPMVILRNPRTGQVRAFLRDPPPGALAEGGVNVGALSPEPGLEALFSRGLPGAREWRR